MENLWSWNGPRPPRPETKMLVQHLQRERRNWQATAADLLRELLDVGDALTAEAHKDSLGRLLPVDPILDVVPIGIALANFVIVLADGGYHLFPVHAHDMPAVLDGL